MRIIGIKTNLGYYITDNVNNDAYFSSVLHRLLINEKEPKASFKRNWFIVDSKPETIQQSMPRQRYNFRYELIDKSLISKFKEFYSETEADDENYDFNSRRGLYNQIYDEMPESIESVPFEFTEILELEVFNEPAKFSYKRAGEWNHRDYPPITEKDVKYDFIAELVTPEILHHVIPCALSQYATYEIIRAYVKENINPKVAQITSDYDFCFKVNKHIKLAKEYTYQVDVSKVRSKKPKYETRVQKTNDITIFEMCHKQYQTYTPVTPFTGKNQKDLQDNIDSYLEHLIAVINEPLEYCPCCEGTGIKTNKQK